MTKSSILSAQCDDWEKIFKYELVTFGDAARDQFGNTYLVGSFSADNFTLGNTTLTLPVGGVGAFIAKFDRDYNVVWAMSPPSGFWSFGRNVEIASDGNVIVAGDFDTSISFGCLSFPGSGRSDIFVVKLFPDGTPIWLTGSTGVDDSNVEAITMSPNGNCILISNFVEKSDVTYLTAPDVKMGGVPVITGAVDQVNAGFDSFVASINPDGTVAWTQGIGGDGNSPDYVEDVTTDSENNIIVTGTCASPEIAFDSYVVHQGYFLAKINPQGQTLWAKDTEGTNDQEGSGVDTDASDNIFVTGRTYGDAKFGPFNLSGKGDADVFVTKFTPDGTAVAATNFGNDNFDAGTGLRVNSHGQVLVSGYYYSSYLELGTYSSTKAATSPADAFVATLSNDLSNVDCARFITGSGSSIIWQFDLDAYDNAIVAIDMMAGDDMEVIVGPETFTGWSYWSALVMLGANPGPNEDEPPTTPGFPPISLGKDTVLCAGQKLVLAVPQFCNAGYKWNTGATGTRIDVTTPGVYWVDVTINGNTLRDEIVVFHHAPLIITLGGDQAVCQMEQVSWSLPQYDETTYTWSNGGSGNENSVTGPGTYWVEVSNRCETKRDEVTLLATPPLAVDLGDDIVSCDADVVLGYSPAPGETILWSNGSTSPLLSVANTGTYQLTVNNGCEEVTDEVKVTMKRVNDVVIPNIVTAYVDGKNDHFLLSPELGKCSFAVYSRWGEKIFYADDYQNNWPPENFSSGVYFYTLSGECVPSLKGTVHVLH